MAKKNKNIGKINLPDVPKAPGKAFKNDEIPEEDIIATNKAIAELKQIKKETLELNKNQKRKDLTKNERLKILQDYAIKKVKANQILEEMLEKATKEYKQKRRLAKTVNADKTAIQKAKQQIRKVEVGYIEYYLDAKSKVYNWIPLHKIPPIIINPKKRELFLMDEAAKFINGKSVFILIKGLPFSIPMEFFIDDLYEKMEKMPNLPKDDKGIPLFGRAHLSSTDLFAKYTSTKTIMLFGIKRSVLQSIAGYILSFIIGMMTLYIIISPYLFLGD